MCDSAKARLHERGKVVLGVSVSDAIRIVEVLAAIQDRQAPEKAEEPSYRPTLSDRAEFPPLDYDPANSRSLNLTIASK